MALLRTFAFSSSWGDKIQLPTLLINQRLFYVIFGMLIEELLEDLKWVRRRVRLKVIWGKKADALLRHSLSWPWTHLISLRIWSSPDWKGMWKNSHIFGSSAQALTSLSVKYLCTENNVSMSHQADSATIITRSIQLNLHHSKAK